jgi:hypothetical protein
MSNKLETVSPIVIPQSHIDFVNAVTDLADAHGMSEFTMVYSPDWIGDKADRWDRRVRGQATINFKAKDGRGRPCRCVDITFDAKIIHVIEEHHPSSN